MEGDKPGKILTRLLQSETPQTVIGAVRNCVGTIVNTQEGIIEVFRQYYIKLYQDPPDLDGQHRDQFVRKAGLTRITPTQSEELEEPIQRHEICGLEYDRQKQDPGMDGFPIEFYKTY